MASDETPKVGKPHLKRDDQKWVFDWVIKETGKVFHFQSDGRGRLPRSVRSHDMISKHMAQAARRMERIADAEAEAGHRATALDLYYQATLQYHDAQHVVFELNDEKRHLHGALMRCFGKVRELSPYRIEHVDIPWNGSIVSGNLHLAPGEGPKPLVFYVPGCDQTKEAWPHPHFNQALQRGMHVFSFDGPGQGESNLRALALTASNYEEAASAAIGYLATRPEVDAARIGVYALSFGSHWGMRIASIEHRVAATVAAWASFTDKHYLMNEESPRYKQLFAYLTQSSSEEAVDRIVADMSMDGRMADIRCPTLVVAGEFDPRAPIDEVYRLFDQMKAPAELWVMADQHHSASVTGKALHAIWEADIHAFACDWLADRFRGAAVRHPGQVLYLEPSAAGPNAASVALKRHWFG